MFACDTTECRLWQNSDWWWSGMKYGCDQDKYGMKYVLIVKKKMAPPRLNQQTGTLKK